MINFGFSHTVCVVGKNWDRQLWGHLILLRILLLNSDMAVCYSKANSWEESVCRKEELSFVKRPITWGKDRLVSKDQLPSAYQGREWLLKRNFKGLILGVLRHTQYLQEEMLTLTCKVEYKEYLQSYPLFFFYLHGWCLREMDRLTVSE